MSQRVLVVASQEALVEGMISTLEKAGYEATTIAIQEDVTSIVCEHKSDLILLDVSTRGVDGIEVCRRIRKALTIPIIMLSSRPDVIDRVVGLEVGADDYVAKPFSERELLARVKAQLRRASAYRASEANAGASQPEEGSQRVGRLEIDLENRSVSKNGRAIPLRRREFDLLVYLVRSRGAVVSRERLLRAIWGDEIRRDSHTVDVHIQRLRRKIERDAEEPKYLHTVRGRGYALRFDGPTPARDTSRRDWRKECKRGER